MSKLEPIDLEYIYVTIPAEYICVYQKILIMMADFGVEMLQDCKASCTNKNYNIIECFNMFNAAVACYKLERKKEAATIIKYIKAKINQIYRTITKGTSFVFPVDETGQLKAFVTCGERPRFEINPDDMELYEHKFKNGFDEHFRLGPEDESKDEIDITIKEIGLDVILTPRYELVKNKVRPCADIKVYWNRQPISLEDTVYQYYFDDYPVIRFNDVVNLETGMHNFKCVVNYNDETKIANVDKYYEASN